MTACVERDILLLQKSRQGVCACACSVCRGTRGQTPAAPTPRCQGLAPGAAPAGQSRWQPSPVPAWHSRPGSASPRSGSGQALPAPPRSAGKGRAKPPCPRAPRPAARRPCGKARPEVRRPQVPRRRCRLRVLAAAARPGPGPGPPSGAGGDGPGRGARSQRRRLAPAPQDPGRSVRLLPFSFGFLARRAGSRAVSWSRRKRQC